jgi:hypothetical protein
MGKTLTARSIRRLAVPIPRSIRTQLKIYKTMNSILSELRTKLDDKIAASKTNGFYSNTQKISWINSAGSRVCNYRNWKTLEEAK